MPRNVQTGPILSEQPCINRVSVWQTDDHVATWTENATDGPESVQGPWHVFQDIPQRHGVKCLIRKNLIIKVALRYRQTVLFSRTLSGRRVRFEPFDGPAGVSRHDGEEVTSPAANVEKMPLGHVLTNHFAPSV